MDNILERRDKFNRGCGIVKTIGNHELLEPQDDYEHVDSTVEYLIENLPQLDDGTVEFLELMRMLKYTYEAHCQCHGDDDCSDSGCCPMGANYAATSNGELVLRDTPEVIFECSPACGCRPTCQNRLVQFGPRKHLVIGTSSTVPNQWGLFTSRFIPNGGFICEYAGEILTRGEAEKRNKLNDSIGSKNYVLCLNEQFHAEKQTRTQIFIDPERRGNIGRYLNHSCDPNCRTVAVHIDSPLPRIGIFAQRDIQPDEELYFDYGGGLVSKPTSKSSACLCGSTLCRGSLPSLSY
ncbi:probable histone-lysine N-methyltransferase set-23 [Wyeomyia smithii]|uniref:probable histone-lysine N-methyltransferase set-23 n=1 Tax=Wyeomyia smithii TaxID=174621 RepID=UPI002467D293|nr:probable histone-lysine N-methyltransferase set-23 [Wyeomyia smithii]